MSTSLDSLLVGVAEVKALRTHFVVRAHGRGCVVLLSSHYERYFYAVNEEAVEWLNSRTCPLSRFPLSFLLQHSQFSINDIAQTAWEKREERLRHFARTESLLWAPEGVTGSLDHSQILTWMKSPKPKDITRFYRHYGIDEVFKAVTRAPGARSQLFFDLKELVEKRNAIAHGDASVEALPADVTRYLSSVAKFTRSADLLLAKKVRQMSGVPIDPW